MKPWMIAVCVWLAVDAAIYLFMWLETVYYRYDIPRIYRRMVDAFTEEE